jgi:RNA polymerase sigma-70 factor (ECF subfamily)
VFQRRLNTLSDDKFSQLYEQHLDAVLSYCLFQVGERQRAEDVTAETFEQAWRDRHRYNPEKASFTTWLFAIARHRIVDHQRKQGRRILLSLNGQYEDDKPPPEETVAREARFAQLYELIKELPDEQRELIALKFGVGLSNRYIAELLNKNESAVGSAVYRIIQKLREQWTVENV